MRVLGYTQVTLDNLSGNEQQPWSSIKYWASLTSEEEKAAKLLGYNEQTWDDKSGIEIKPDSHYKFWDELTGCDESELSESRCHSLPVYTKFDIN